MPFKKIYRIAYFKTAIQVFLAMNESIGKRRSHTFGLKTNDPVGTYVENFYGVSSFVVFYDC